MSVPNMSLAQDLFSDMGRKVAEASEQNDLGEGDSKVVDEIESLCMNCKDDGTTRLLLTKIPFFREIILMSFSCPHCHFHNSEVQFAGQIQQRGARFKLRADSATDLSRQLVKSDTCVFRVEELDLEIPAGRGQLTNVEGILDMVRTDLAEQQDARREQMPEVWAKIETIIVELEAFGNGRKFPFTITVDDPAGNSYVEPSTEDTPGKYSRQEYARSSEQNVALGLTDTNAADEAPITADSDAPPSTLRPEYQANQMYPSLPNGTEPDSANIDASGEIVPNEVYSFPASCPGCTRPCATNMKMVNIPHFKQVVLMSTVCGDCGYRSNEVKTGGAVPERGRRITLDVRTKEDLSRDILKAESCALECPELALQVEPGTLGGRFTTIEGLLTQVRDDLRASIFSDAAASGTASEADAGDLPPEAGDSMDAPTLAKWTSFFAKLSRAISGQEPFKLILSDPLASSYLQSLGPDAGVPDEQMTIEEYDRTEEEEEHLGLRDIRVEGYEEDDGQGEKGIEAVNGVNGINGVH